MDVKRLYSIIAVADHGSFNAAARALGMSLSAISVQMRMLEEDMEMVLFDRSRRPPPLTEEGREFVGRARELIADWERLSASLKRSPNGGLLKIGAVHTTVSGLLPAALLQLRQAMPDLSIRLTTGLSHDLEAALRGGRIDVAVTTQPDNMPSDLEFTPFCDEPLVVIAGHAAAGKGFREVLQSNAYVRFNRQARVGALIDEALAANRIKVTSAMEVDTLEGVISLVGAGLGVSVVPARSGIAFPDTIAVLPFGRPKTVRRLGVLAQRRNARQHFFSPFLEALKQASRDR
ncbi:MAG TPA: LysR family transcriptional regulator [Afifellaceae bacterium]|nr:LysR family transcriptional regulator [Afifellaceae bacterium]